MILFGSEKWPFQKVSSITISTTILLILRNKANLTYTLAAQLVNKFVGFVAILTKLASWVSRKSAPGMCYIRINNHTGLNCIYPEI